MFIVHVLVAAVLASSTLATRDLTNAQRIARGLAPARPRRLYDPTRTHVHYPRASGPDVVKLAKISVTSYSPSKRDGLVERGDPLYIAYEGNGGHNTVDTTPLPFEMHSVDSDEMGVKLLAEYDGCISDCYDRRRSYRRDTPAYYFSPFIVGGNTDISSGTDASHCIWFDLDSELRDSSGGSQQALIFNEPAIGNEVSATWHNADSTKVDVKFYWQGGAGGMLLAGGKGSDCGVDETLRLVLRYEAF